MSLTKLEGSSGKVECLSVVVHKDEKGYGMTVSGNDPVLVQSVVKNGAAWRAGVRIADKLLRVNGTSVETAVHQDVVDMIKSSNMVELYLQRACTTKITAPIPVDREIQRQVENTRRQTLQRMLESQNNHIDCLRSELARGGSERCINELEAAETNRTHLQQQLEKLGHPMIITSQNRMKTSNIDPPTPSRHSILSNIPRSLSNLTGQSIRGNRSSQPPVTCLDGTPPPLPPRTPVALSPNNHSPKGPSPGGQVPKPPPMNMFNRHMEPNSIGVQMNYPLAVTHPPIQSGGMGHQRSRSSPEQLSQINNSIDKEWDTVITPPGTPPPPYPSSPIPQAPIESQRAILSMEEDDGPWPIIHHSTYYNRSFSNVDSLSPARMAIFLNWIIGERRPPQAALLYLLTAVYSSSTSEFLPHWPYELHSAFLVPGAPLLLHNVDENMAKTIDDILIKNTDKDNLKNIFLKVREKAKEELNEQLNEFQIKRQSGLGAFYGPADSVLEQCDNDRHKELSVITEWLLPQLNLWLNESGADHWEATYGSSTVSLLAAAVHPLLRYFGFKTQMINEFLRSPTQGSPPRPEFLQMNRHYKQRVRLLKKSSTHPLIIRGHRLSPLAVVSVSHCQQCHLLIWGIAPQAYICSDCKLLVHRCCAKEVEENCCGPAPLASRKSRLMDRLAPPALTSNLGNSHQHIDSNQHFYHHHHHDKKQRKSLGTSNFLNMERNLRRNEEEMPGMDMNSSHHSDFEYEINGLDEIHHEPEDKIKAEDEEEGRDAFREVETTAVVLSDSECEPEKKKKPKTKHRKTMSVSNTIELVRSMGDEWIEAAKREIGEHSKKRENMRKKKEQSPPDHDKKQHSVEHNDNVVLLLSDATITETDEFEIAEHLPPSKANKKKEAKVKDTTPKVSTSQIMPAQKMAVRMIAKASTVGALNFIRKKRPAPIVVDNENLVDHILLSTALFIDSERTHTDLVRNEEEKIPLKKVELSDASTNSGDEIDGDIFYDAKALSQEDTDTADEEPVVKKQVSKSESKKSKSSSELKVIALRSRKTFNGSLKRTGGGRRKGKRRSSTDEAPPLPPKNFLPPPPPPKPSHWLFGTSFKGDSKRDADDNNLDGSTHHSDTSHQFSEHSFDIADNSKRAVRQRPVKTESFRDKAANVQRTKRNTSDPKLLASENALNDAESSGILGGQYGGSSKSSLSSSNEQIDDSDVHLEAFEEEENAEPWSTKALPDILASMSLKARKRQDLIHELIASEVSHVRWLRILRHVFYNPLHQHSMLTDDELNNLFPNLPAVLQKHRKLCTDLKTLAADSPIVQTKPLAEALIATLGEPKYPKALAKFCKGQRLALDSLRDKRKRTKELNAFLTKCEQDPLCARLHLQELLACVWQRLTKYQLLLDGIIKTVKDENSSDAQIPDDDGLAKLEQALNIAKDVLHTVNTAVKTTENKKRLKDIQKKMEIRGSMTGSMTGTGSSNVSGSANLGGGVGVSGNSSTAGSTESDHGDLRKLDLNQHSLVMEGTLSIRIDVAKQTTVLALFLSECLVLLQRETDRYILRPIPRAGLSHPLSPIVRWDTVFFRSDASTKFGFLLLGINGRHMYELAATNHSEYNMWIKHITEFANAVGPRSGTVEEGPPPPLPSNPPPSTIPSADIVSNGTSDENTTNEGETPQPPKDEDDGKTISGAVQSVEGEVSENRRPSGVSMIAEDLITPASVAIVTPPIALTAERLITPEERLRQAEEKIAIALQEAAEAAKETASAKPSIYSAMGTLLGSTNRQTIVDQSDQESKNKEVTVSTMELLLTAQSHVNTLTEVLLKALRVTPVECSMTVCSLHVNSGLCDTCAAQHSKFSSSTKNVNYDSEKAADDEKITFETCNGTEDSKNTTEVCIATSSEHPEEKIDSILQLEEVGESSTDPCNDPTIDLVTSSSLGLREILATLIQRLPAEEKEREFLRARLQQSDQRLHRLHHLHKDCVITESSSDATNTVQEVPNSSSTDQSGGEG